MLFSLISVYSRASAGNNKLFVTFMSDTLKLRKKAYNLLILSSISCMLTIYLFLFYLLPDNSIVTIIFSILSISTLYIQYYDLKSLIHYGSKLFVND